MNYEINEDSSDEDIPHLPAQKSKKKVILSDSEGEGIPSISLQSNDDEDIEDAQHLPKRRVKKKQIRKLLSSNSEHSASESGSNYYPSEQSDSDEKENGCTPPSRKKSAAVVTPVAASSRRSSRLKSKEHTRSSFSTPDRRKYLEEVSPSLRSDKRPESGIRKKLYANNLVLGRNSYNSERSYETIEYSDESDDGFIVDIVEDMDEEKEEDDEEPINKKRRRKEPTKRKKKKRVMQSSDEEVEMKREGDFGDKSLSTLSPRTNTRIARRNKEKDHFRTLEILKGKRKGEKVDLPESDESSNESPIASMHEIFNLSQKNNSDDDFIVDDEDEDELSAAQGEHFEELLKDVKDALERKTTSKSLQNVLQPPTKCPSQSSSTDDDMQGDEPFLTRDDEFFMDIVNRNDIREARKFIKGHRSVIDKCLSLNRTPLHIAAIHGYNDMMQLLLSFSAKTSVRDSLHYTPLGYAAQNKHFDCLHTLLEKSDVAGFSRHLHKKFKGKNLLHFIIDTPLNANSFSESLPPQRDIEDDIVQCFHVVKQFKVKMYWKLLDQVDGEGNNPLRHAVVLDRPKVLEYFLNEMSLEMMTKELQFKTSSQEGNLLHFAVLSKSPLCLQVLITRLAGRIDEADNSGFTPLMYAAEIPNCDDCLELLLNFNASVHVQDEDGVTPLHLSASCGNLRSIQLLLDYGHKVDCVDRHGWPPLLYANFRASEECVITLMEKNPNQIFCLGNLITRSGNEEIRKKNMKVIQDTLVCISQVDRYYTIFNDFIARNLNILDENDHGCFTTTWRMILSFNNKVKWMRLKCRRSVRASYGRLQIDRSNVMECALNQLPSSFNFTMLDVRFVGEEGMCLGPKREFCTLFAQELCGRDRRLFMKVDGEQYSPTPNTYFLNHMKANPSNFKEPSADQFKTATFVDGINFQDDALDEALLTVDTEGDTMAMSDSMFAAVDLEDRSNLESAKIEEMRTLRESESVLEHRLKLMRLVGQFSANVVLDEEIFVRLQFSKPFVKQILGMELNHPADLADQDHQTYTGIKDNHVDDLDLIFSVGTLNPWNDQLEEIMLGGRGDDVQVTEGNKHDYLKELSEFKLCTAISEELRLFQEGFYTVIREDIINIFNADEFSLLLNGVTEIDIQDWKKNTQLIGGWSWSSPEIEWFWEVVGDLKEEEKALLLKFSTASPCVPVGGFSKLRGLHGANLFTITTCVGIDKLPEAATCFNLVRLCQYSSKMILREKLLIAIRHGCEGFTMG